MPKFASIDETVQLIPNGASVMFGNVGMDSDLDSGLQFEANLFGLSFATEDKHEGMSAFLEKRKGKTFTGR